MSISSDQTPTEIHTTALADAVSMFGGTGFSTTWNPNTLCSCANFGDSVLKPQVS